MIEDAPLRYAFAAATALFLVIVFHVTQRLLSPRHTLKGDARGANAAFLLVQAGHLAAVLLLVPGIVQEALTHETIGAAALWAAVFGALGIALVQLVGGIGVRLLLRASLAAELETGNLAAGLAAGANYVAVGLLAAAAFSGSDLQDVGLSCVFFSLAVLAQALCVGLFRALTVYDDQEQIQGENMAAAISYAGVTVAVSVILARAVSGGVFLGWVPALLGFGGVALSALALYPLRQIVVEGLVLGNVPRVRGGALDQAIGVDRNTGLAALEALAYLATALALVQLV